MTKFKDIGHISAIYGTLLNVKGFQNIKIKDLVKIKNSNILGEIIRIFPDYAVVQCFEDTENISLYEEVINLEEPLSMELGPGLLSNIYDGLQRPLNLIYKSVGSFLQRGVEVPPLSREKKWEFFPLKKLGDKVVGGDVLGVVQETHLIKHKILVPPKISGKISFIVSQGNFTILDNICKINSNGKDIDIQMLQKWPVYINRPYKSKYVSKKPLISGIRVIDFLFPIAMGGVVAVPGGFGTGKTIIQHSLAKWCNADIIIFVGCGERGNEMADILKEFPKLIDPTSKRPLMERTIFIANTSNMPISAREASIFSGVTMAEYYRDMGYNVAVLADSTSRWAEALREISGLLEEMPAEGGFPAYLPKRLSEFYERAGVVQTLGNERSEGSITLVGSISPPGGDFSEPITNTTKRFVQAFWALDATLAYSRHYPAINWLDSYSNYTENLIRWWKIKDIDWEEISIDWEECRSITNLILSRENELKNIVQLIGMENLPLDQQLTLFIANLIKNAFLIQNAFDEIDKFCSPRKLMSMIKLIFILYNKSKNLIKSGGIIDDIKELESIEVLNRMRYSIKNENIEEFSNIKKKMIKELEELGRKYEERF